MTEIEALEQTKINNETLRNVLDTTKKKLLTDAYTSLAAALVVSCAAVIIMFQREGWLISRLFVNEQIYMLIKSFFVSYSLILFVHTASTFKKVSKLNHYSSKCSRSLVACNRLLANLVTTK